MNNSYIIKIVKLFISFHNQWSEAKWKSLSCVQFFAIPGIIACQSPLSLGFSSQEYWSGLPCFSPGDLPNPEIEPRSPSLQEVSLLSEPLGKSFTINAAAAAAAKSLQSCDPIDGSPPASSVPGILQARIPEWVVISFSNACMHAKSLQSCPTLCDPM